MTIPAAAGPGQAARPAFDASTPNTARIYDYLLGGKDHYTADRDQARQLLARYPPLAAMARENRAFLDRFRSAARYASGPRASAAPWAPSTAMRSGLACTFPGHWYGEFRHVLMNYFPLLHLSGVELE